jgi:hypothetical protein
MENLEEYEKRANESIENQKQILSQIKEIQNIEKQLYKSLEVSSVNPNSSLPNELKIVENINKYSDLRTNLYDNLKSNYNSTQNNVIVSRNNLVDEYAVVKVIENEMNSSKKNLNALKNNRYDSLRMVEINTYYGKRYEAYAYLMRTVVFICIPLLILAILIKKGLLSENIGGILISMVVAIGSIIVFYKIYDISIRDNMNYDEFDWSFNPESVDVTDANTNSDDQPQDPSNNSSSNSYVFGCVGETCCADGTKFDTDKKKCVEGFENAIFTGNSFSRSDAEINIFSNSDNIKPYSNSVNFASV